MTGALIGAMTPRPWVAIPVAVVSHFVLDVMPHFGRATKYIELRVIMGDAVIVTLLIIGLMIAQPQHWTLILLAGVAATLPDALWAKYFIAEWKGVPRPMKKLDKFLHDIQWGERPWGMVIEAPFALILLGAYVGILGL